MPEPVTTVDATTLFTRFRQLPSALTADNGVMLVGLARVTRGYTKNPTDGYIGQYTGSLLTAPWPSLGAGETVVQSTATAKLVNAIVRFYSETGAPGATKGTQYGTALNKITHNGTATVWTGSGFTPALNVPLQVGDYVRLDNNGATVLHTRVTGFQAISGAMKVLILADSIPAALRGVGVYFNVSVGQVTDVYRTSSQLTMTATDVAIPGSITASTTRTGSAYPVIGATLPAGTILGAAYVNYTASYPGTFTNTVREVRTAADVAALFPDTAPSSGLGFAASISISAVVPNLVGGRVLVVAPTDDTLASYQAVIDLIRFRNGYSTLAVLSEDASVIAAFEQLITDRAANYQPTQLWLCKEFTRDIEIGSSTIATIDDSQTPLEQRTVSVASGAPFATALAGDTVRHYTSPTVYVSYIIATVISSQAVTLTSAVPGGPLSNQTIEVWHHLTTSEQVADAISEAQAIGRHDINLIYPDTFIWVGEAVPPYMMAAYMAAVRSWSAPQQMLSYFVPGSEWTSPDTAAVYGFQAQLAAGGLFVFDVSTSGRLYIRFPRTTDPATVASSNSIFTAIEQFCTRYIAAQLLPYLGLYRTSSELYARLRTVATTAISTLQSTDIVPIGPIILSGTVGVITRSTTNANAVVVPVTLNVAGIAEDVLQLEISVVLE